MTGLLWDYLAIAKQLLRKLCTASVYSVVWAVPVVEPLPISVAIHLSDELRTFAHEEAVRDYGTFRIAVGAAQELMFNNLAQGMFANHRLVSGADVTSGINPTSLNPADVNSSKIDAILVPNISELQFSIPAQTKSDFFEVWLNYNFRLLTPDGSPIAEWPMKAYGRANKRNYGFLENTPNGALQEASRVALRDAMAVFTFKFKRVPGVQQWLQQYNGADKQSTPTAPASNGGAELGQPGGYE